MKELILPVILILVVLLFVGGPNSYDGRLFKELWEMGHFALFASLVFFLLRLSLFRQIPWIVLAIFTTVFCIVFGFITETLQLLVGRNFQMIDIFIFAFLNV